jgi:site-specific DNA-methyltransferase (adenine-specific)
VPFQIRQGDALHELRKLADGSVDAIITDPPYGTTGLDWDKAINVDQMWNELKRIVKPKGAVVLFCNQPFTSQLIVSNLKQFKYCWVWQKSKGTGFLNAKNAPIEYHEDIAVFSSGTTANCSPERMSYFPQGLRPISRVRRNIVRSEFDSVGLRPSRLSGSEYKQDFEGYPTTILNYANDGEGLHPTQKPVDLMRFLVCSYTQEGETVLDFTMGSGSTGVACVIEKRDFIGIEIDEHFCAVAQARMERASGSAVDIPQRQKVDKEMPLFG